MLTISDRLLKYRRRISRIGGANSWLSGIGKDPFGPSQLLTRPAGESHRPEVPQLQEHVTGSALHIHPQGWHNGPRYIHTQPPPLVFMAKPRWHMALPGFFVLVFPFVTNWDMVLARAVTGFIVGTVTGIIFLDSPWLKVELSLGLLGAFVGLFIGWMFEVTEV